ncbi:MAG TPA: ATP-binding protein [Vicinamibacterales bacterium]|nr:ATP-binding protein [Vicinamibacterales bacterium]
MRAPLSIAASHPRSPIQPKTAGPRHRRQPVEAALTRFASDLSAAQGAQFFDLLVEFVAEELGFDAAIVGELPAGGASRFLPIAEYPAADAATRAIITTHCDDFAASARGPRSDAAGQGCIDVPLLGSDGRPIGVICAFGRGELLEATTTRMLFRIIAHRAAAELERQRAQRDLERRDALFVGLIAEAHDVVGVLDQAGAFTAVSPAIERVLGYQAEDCIGVAVIDLVHVLDRPAVDALLKIQDTHGYSIEARLLKKDGGWLTMEVTYAQHEENGRRFKVLSARDLTDQRLLEDRLRQSQKTEIIGRLASGIVHDFGNILMVVGCHADLMRMRTDADDPRHADVDAIQAAVTRGADLARQLLAISKHREFEMRRMDLNASIEQLAAMLRRLVGSTITLETDLSPHARYIAADATQIEQIVLNLTLNARDAMPNGGKITFVTAPVGDGDVPPVVAEAPEDYVCFSVIDTGCGIREDVMPHIFEPLFTTKQDGSGTGIGLATVHDIVMRHGGGIEVASAEGQGATFRLYLPRHVTPARKIANTM